VTDTGVVFRPGEMVDDVQIVLSNRLSIVTGSVAADAGGPVKDYVSSSLPTTRTGGVRSPGTSAQRSRTSAASLR
jgi:hypothetical protein